jgi:ABC-type microcin C transport system duplicated ATPase subunit YejF
MVKVKYLPQLLRISAKLDLLPLAKVFRMQDLIRPDQTGLKSLNGEQVAAIGFELMAVLLPQLGSIGDDLAELIALVKGVSIAEAGEMDAIQCVKDVLSEAGVLDFFTQRLKKIIA